MQQPAVGLVPGAPSAGALRTPRGWRFAQFAGSPRVTLWLLALLGAAVIMAYQLDDWRGWPLASSLVLLAVNLCAALATHAGFRAQGALTVFHLGLAALLVLIAAGQLTYLKGTLELLEGAEFDGTLLTVDAGRFHRGALAQARFSNRGFTIDYDVDYRRGPTRNRVGWRDGAGVWREQTIGDQEPLVLHGYRFYTSFNKGFAPVFEFRPSTGPVATGAVHLPSYPIHEFGQAQAWTLPGTGREVWIKLDPDEAVLDPGRPSTFRVPERYSVVVRAQDQRWTLRPGDSVDLPEGRLTLTGLRSWMGYNVFYDWTLPWLASTVALCVLALGWHFAGKFRRARWDA